MLTLLKQARAFGLGVVLATQNPVDLDYKGLGNAGTWFLGRLQTERDKLRVLDGLEGAAAAAALVRPRARTTRMLSGLKQRIFLMVNAHDDQPTLLQTRWALSYLRGPLTRAQIVTLKDRMPAAKAYAEATAAAKASGAGPSSPARAGAAAGGGGSGAGGRAGAPRARSSGRRRRGVPARGAGASPGARLEYRPSIYGAVKAHYVDAKSAWTSGRTSTSTAPVPDETATDPWDGATVAEGTPPDLEKEPAAGATFAAGAGRRRRPKTFPAWQKALEEHVYRTRSVTLLPRPGAQGDEHARRDRGRVPRAPRRGREGAARREGRGAPEALRPEGGDARGPDPDGRAVASSARRSRRSSRSGRRSSRSSWRS